MSHENSETGTTPFGAVNVYGRKTSQPGRILPPIFQFERKSYPDVKTAELAAARRSQLNAVPGWNPSLSDLLRSNPQIGKENAPALDVSVGTPNTNRTLTPTEVSMLRQAARTHGIDAGMLRALALVENGPQVSGPEGPTRGLGVVSVPAPTLNEQADVAAKTLSNTLSRYRKAFNREPFDPKTGRYTPEFLSYFSRGGPGYPGYAPLGAANDPTDLNKHHLRRLLQMYQPDTGIKSLPDLMPYVLGAPR